jgi:phage antirepressor YoqD-like protein
MEGISKEQTLSIAEVAKLVDFAGGEYKFFAWLREKGYLLQDNTPAQLYRDRGWLKLMDSNKSIGNSKAVIPVTRVTLKGIAGIDRAVKKHFPICKPCNDAK